MDVLIVGAGPIGLACGIECKKAGLDYRIFDKGVLVNSLYNYPLNMTFFSTSEKLEIGEVPFVSIANKPTRAEALEYYRRVASNWDLNINLYEAILGVKALRLTSTSLSTSRSGQANNGFYEVKTSKNTYKTKAIILATGFYDFPYLMKVPGENLPKVTHYYKEPHPYIGQKVAVVGGANSAVDAALECYRKGAEVTVIVRDKSHRKSVKYWVKPDIENRIKEGSIKAFFNSEITEIRAKEIDIKTPNGKTSIKNDFVIAMTGYKPDFQFLENLGIELEGEKQKPKYNPETHESNQKNIYLAGVICGGLITNEWFIENSAIHAKMIVEDLKKKGF